MPTLLALAGAGPDPKRPLDGTDLPELHGGEPAGEERTLFWRFRDRKAVRRGPWKLVLGEDDAPETALFNLEQDPGEQVDVAGRHPQRVESLLEALARWERDVDTEATPQPPRP